MQGIFANTEDKKYGIVPQRVFLITGLIHTELLLAQVVSPALDPRSAHHQTFLGCPSVPSDCCVPMAHITGPQLEGMCPGGVWH